MVALIEIDLDVVYEFTDGGFLKTQSMFNELVKDKRITKKNNNVVDECISNLLFEGYPIESAYYNTEKRWIELRLSSFKYRICPRCGREIKGYPALSREDNKTEICSECGQEEALEAFTNNIKENNNEE